MAFNLSKKSVCSVDAFVYYILSLLIISLIASHYPWIQRLHHQNQLANQGPKMQTDTTDGDLQQVTNSDRVVGCDRSHFRYDLCYINGSTVLDPTKATLYSVGPTTSSSERIKPYPGKWEAIMDKIRAVTLKSGPIGGGLKCKVQHNSPAVVFSAGGHTRNFFHSFADGLLPLYITLNNLNLTDRDVILVVDEAHDWWVHKYADLIRAFTKHPIINLIKDTSTHCFSRAVVGLVTHGIMVVDPKARPSPLTMSGFHSFLRSVYTQELVAPKHPKDRRRPKLVWVIRSRSEGRAILNQDEARVVAQEVGFDVVIFKPTDSVSLRDAYELLDGSHAMMGTHGAGMTHVLFLRPGSVVVQIAPLGLEWLGDMCFGKLSRELGMDYLEYKVEYNESSLSGKYAKEDPILKDAREFLEEKGWVQNIMDVYLKEQNVKLDLLKFRSYMEKVYERAKRFMESHG